MISFRDMKNLNLGELRDQISDIKSKLSNKAEVEYIET